MTPEQITKWAVEVGMNPVMEFGYTRFASPSQLQAFAQLVRNAALFEAMEVCIDQGELKDHDAMDCYYAIQRLKS